MQLIYLCLCALVLWAAPLSAQSAREKVIPLDAQWNATGTVLTLDWQDAKPLRVGPVDINRRPLGATGGQSWALLVENLQRSFFIEDLTPERGTAYEYQVIRRARDVVDVGYWLAGWEIPAVQERGIALLVIEQSIADALAPRLDRFAQDLIGDGWQVRRHIVPRNTPDAREDNLATGRALRRWITAEAEKSPQTSHSLILLGHVPVMESGRVAPDGHESVPHATDLFYADIGRRWPDGEVGKLRPSTLPDLQIDMTVGRIDFQPIAEGDPFKEQRLIARYLDRNHHWRHGHLDDLRTAYGQNNTLAVERAALRNIVGPDAIEPGGHQTADPAKPFLVGVDFGSRKAEDYTNQGPKPAFAINFGSNKQKFSRRNNAMLALLALDWVPLAVGWGGRPSWQLQHLALGGTIGEAHKRTVNNGPWRAGAYRDVLDYYPTGQYLWRGPIWVNLMGDPTLHAFVLPPPVLTDTSRTGSEVTLNWQAPEHPQIQGVQVFRAAAPGAPFAPISEVLPETRFTDTDASKDAVYMLRAYGLQEVHAGSFFAYSQGVFAGPDVQPLPPVQQTLSTPRQTPVRIPTPQTGIWSFIFGPAQGSLTQDADGWLYTPAEATSGTVTLRNAISDAWGTAEGTTTITIGD